MVDGNSIAVALLNGMANGMLLFLAAVGLTLIFGVLGVLNFAHGSLYMLGAYFTFFLVNAGGPLAFFNGNFWLAVLVAPVLVAVIGGLMERFIIRPIYERDHVFQLLLTFALVLVIDNAARILWGTDFRSISVPRAFAFQVPLFGSNYPAYNLFLIVVGVAFAGAMWLVFERTRVGKTVRAAAQDRDVANALGVNVPALFTAMFVTGSVLAAVGGALAAPYQTIQPTMGENIIINSFIVVVIGGLGSFAGAFVGALLIGVVNSLAFLFAPALQPVIPFVLMAVVLLSMPVGLFGKEVAA
ncbi:branched-chain amino acid ABC transporter permease [Halomarina halobia]|uniref:Branched-chain amino acid ABC transporter permease n=1 Tax=Halomarina halobia TaxID=3033386 RepID=A0ABD6ADV9_9EURY|nr:branched-chain amino acid ABC transporter permease [Halomarina sp. PSR21]